MLFLELDSYIARHVRWRSFVYQEIKKIENKRFIELNLGSEIVLPISEKVFIDAFALLK